MEELLLTIKQVGQACGLSRSFIYQQIASGLLRPTYFGRAVRIHRDELNRWIASQQEQCHE